MAGVGGSVVSRPARVQVQDRGPGHQGELKCLGARPTSCLTPSHAAAVGSRQGGTVYLSTGCRWRGGRPSRASSMASKACRACACVTGPRGAGTRRTASVDDSTRLETGVRSRQEAGLDPEGSSLAGLGDTDGQASYRPIDRKRTVLVVKSRVRVDNSTVLCTAEQVRR